ncbi:hypothetical protein [Microvirga arabica]|uniref:hypothetical protein n=1 Tax=Microvirga arabica TaxID=1128671 RepID=UPI001939D08E|nr:hypothetical protein [Microvirga arabica]MBM1172810.1 hypothetical protein [Microvirga arabica]
MLDLSRIHKGMQVPTSDDHRLGTVREIMEHVIFLDEVEAQPGTNKTSVPMIWINDAVRLTKSRDQVLKEWQARPASSL